MESAVAFPQKSMGIVVVKMSYFEGSTFSSIFIIIMKPSESSIMTNLTLLMDLDLGTKLDPSCVEMPSIPRADHLPRSFNLHALTRNGIFDAEP